MPEKEKDGKLAPAKSNAVSGEDDSSRGLQASNPDPLSEPKKKSRTTETASSIVSDESEEKPKDSAPKKKQKDPIINLKTDRRPVL